MNNDEIKAAYERLSELDLAANMPALDIHQRLLHRRRRRAGLAILGAFILAAAGTGVVLTVLQGDSDEITTSIATDSSTTTPTAEVTSQIATPAGLSCHNDLRESVTFDYLMPPTELAPNDPVSKTEVAQQAAAGDSFVLDGSILWLLRGDGSAYAKLELSGTPLNGFHAETMLNCEGENAQTRQLSVTLKVGPCWVEALQAKGNTWLPLRTEQFGTDVGTSGVEPDGFTGSGDVRWWSKSQDRLQYFDSGGARIDLYPASDSRTDHGIGCD